MPYKNKKDQKKYSAIHYKRNKKIYKKRANLFKQKAFKRNKKFINEYLKVHPCVDCGNDNVIVLDFDHIKSKERNIADMVHQCMSIENIKKEIEKCEVRCANCHRITTHNRRIKKIKINKIAI